jgi:hypothetical protein
MNEGDGVSRYKSNSNRDWGECLIDIVSYFVFAVDVYQILVLSGRQLKLHKTILKTSLKVGGHLYNSILTIRLSK